MTKAWKPVHVLASCLLILPETMILQRGRSHVIPFNPLARENLDNRVSIYERPCPQRRVRKQREYVPTLP